MMDHFLESIRIFQQSFLAIFDSYIAVGSNLFRFGIIKLK